MAAPPTTESSSDALWSVVPAGAPRDLLLAALEAFAERGFHAATTRQIGGLVGLSPAAVYVHYPSKTELLYRIASIGHAAVLAEVEQALESVSAPADRVRALASTMARWHAEHHTLARVTQYELRSLPAQQQRSIKLLRKRFTARMREEIVRGVEAGDFDVPDVRGTGDAILSLAIDVARWYRPGGGRRPDAIAELYGELAVRMVRPARKHARRRPRT